MEEKNKIVYLICITALIVLSVAFYWFEWRPSRIRENCMQLVQQGKFSEETVDSGGGNLQQYLASRGLLPKGTVDNLYLQCVRSKGLKD